MFPLSAVATALGTLVSPARRLRSSSRKRGASGLVDAVPSKSVAWKIKGLRQPGATLSR